MEKVYTSALVIIPPEEIWEPIQAIRRIYDRQIDKWMPHISLLYPFRPIRQFDQIREDFKNVILKISPFEIRLINIKSFTHSSHSHTIWLSPDPSGKLKLIQAKLLALTPDCNDLNRFDGGFTPHLSVGQIKGTKKELFHIITQLKTNWEDVSFILSKISYITRDSNKSSSFKITREFFID